MAVRKLEHVGIMVSNMEKSIAFYTEIVGLKHLYTMTHTNGVIRLAFLAGADGEESELELIENYPGELAPEGRTHHVAFTVDDVEAEFKRISDLDGVKLRDTEIRRCRTARAISSSKARMENFLRCSSREEGFKIVVPSPKARQATTRH